MVTLRDYSINDVDRLVELANNENVSRYMVDTFPYPYTRQDAEWWINTGSISNDMVNKVIEYHDEFVGGIGIIPQTGWKKHSAEIGYWIGEDYWGKGIATKALGLMTDMVFRELNYQKLFAGVLSPNIASMKVMEKCGYVLEGILLKEFKKNEQLYDCHHYARLAEIS